MLAGPGSSTTARALGARGPCVPRSPSRGFPDVPTADDGHGAHQSRRGLPLTPERSVTTPAGWHARNRPQLAGRFCDAVFIGSMMPEPASGWPYVELLRILRGMGAPRPWPRPSWRPTPRRSTLRTGAWSPSSSPSIGLADGLGRRGRRLKATAAPAPSTSSTLPRVPTPRRHQPRGPRGPDAATVRQGAQPPEPTKSAIACAGHVGPPGVGKPGGPGRALGPGRHAPQAPGAVAGEPGLAADYFPTSEPHRA